MAQGAQPPRFLRLKILIHKISQIHPLVLGMCYVAVYLAMELLVHNPIRFYIYNVILAMSGVYFAWFLGGKKAMGYVAFFNIFIVFIFSKMLWSHGVVVSWRVFFARTFLVMYVVAAVLLYMMLRRKSPADKRQEAQEQAVSVERSRRQNLEFMVASRKLKHDLLAQANLVKDELQLLEGAWRSNIHDIINDLPTVKEREIYQQIIIPFQNNIIQHLRALEHKLTFDVQYVRLDELYPFLESKMAEGNKRGALKKLVSMEDAGWGASAAAVLVDKNKVWDIFLNVLRNSQTALDMRRLEYLRKGALHAFTPRIRAWFGVSGSFAVLRIVDNGGGVDEEVERKLYREPVRSIKRQGQDAGQGTLFVKFFADRMDMHIQVRNDQLDGEPGLAVELRMRLAGALEHTVLESRKDGVGNGI